MTSKFANVLSQISTVKLGVRIPSKIGLFLPYFRIFLVANKLHLHYRNETGIMMREQCLREHVHE